MESNQNRKVRVIAKIKGSSELSDDAPLAPWIKVHKPQGDQSSSVGISFGDQTSSRKEVFEVDYCYEQSEKNELIFSREVKPLISGVFGGCNVSVVACGATSSGKTYVIQGTDEEPGLAVLAMAEILSLATESGKSIAISVYEVFQDRVLDLLDPKRPEVTVLEAQGKIQLRGILQVPVKSMEEFQKIYINSSKTENKTQNELPNRSHRGLIVNIFADSERSDNIPVGKMNFVDLAGYEDLRRKSSEGHNQVENSRINRSIYNFQNVIHALNSNESHVPYRETKLTHMLKDSLGGANKILMVTCVNPSLCQDSVYMVKLASRSCSNLLDSTKKTKSSTISLNHSSLKSTPSSTVNKIAPMVSSSQNSQTPGTIKTKTPMILSSQKSQTTSTMKKATTLVHSSQKSQTTSTMKKMTPLVHSSQKSQTPGTMKKMTPLVHTSQKSQTPGTMKKTTPLVHTSQKSQTPGTMKKTTPLVHTSQNKMISSSATTTVNKRTVPRIHFSAKKTNGTASSIKGRKLFDQAGNLDKLEKNLEKETSNVKISDLMKVDGSPTIVLYNSVPAPIVDSSRAVLHDIDSDNGKVDDALGTIHDSDSAAVEHCEDTTCPNSTTKATSSDEEGQNIDKENNIFVINECGSPPLFARIQEIVNNIKYDNIDRFDNLLQPSFTEVSTVSEVSSVSQASYDLVEPKTVSEVSSVSQSSYDLAEPKTVCEVSSDSQASYELVEPKTPEHRTRVDNRWETSNVNRSPWETFSARSSGMKHSLVQEYLNLINTGSKDELKRLKGIGEKRATYILEMREESPEPFKSLDDLKDIGLSAKQIKGLMKRGIEEILN
ncbi:hypothetical protein ACFE04_028593 [Oxalis oulophora]